MKQRQGSTTEALQLLVKMSPFLVEGERIFSLLRSVDLLRLLVWLEEVTGSACVNHFLHDAVYQDGVWQTAFFQEDEEELAPALQNANLRVLYNLINPQPIVPPNRDECEKSGTESEKSGDETEESGDETDEEMSAKESGNDEGGTEDRVASTTAQPVELKSSPVSLKELSLLYKITERQGWYVNKEGICFFLRFKDNAKKTYDVIYRDIATSELDSLIRQVWYFGICQW